MVPAFGSIAALATSIAYARAHSITEVRAAKEGMIHRLARVIEYRELELAATMHDVGKVAVPD